MIRIEAVTSYFQTKASPKSLIDRPALHRMAIEQVVVNRLMSA